jgi:hypothetical protein
MAIIHGVTPSTQRPRRLYIGKQRGYLVLSAHHPRSKKGWAIRIQLTNVSALKKLRDEIDKAIMSSQLPKP